MVVVFKDLKSSGGSRKICIEEQHLEQIWGVVTALEKSDTYPSSEGHINIF